MDEYLSKKEKLAKVNAIRRELLSQSSVMCSKGFETLMKLYGLNELIQRR